MKNVFVAAPLVFSRNLENTTYLVRTAIAMLAFCMLSGAVYCFNDVRDVEADKLHPTKQHRPIAAGELSERSALIASGVLAVIALGACFAVHWQLAMWAALYFAQNIAYSVKLKHVAFIDVLLIASGFLLRVLGGAAAIDVPASGWLLACTGLVAVFFALGKRAHELAWAERSGKATTATRAALAGYRLSHVRTAMFLLGAMTSAAYVAYTLDARTVEMFHTDRLVYSAPFVVLGIVRFFYLALWRPKTESPTEAMLRDPLFLLDLAAATATVLYIIYA
ncbi:MAG TPA: UbiA prenyltransferase family protein [Kofleriaceae bacterium]|nr:UbiA prenyltransferase family protein [Kofleriaceae bacterium]